MSPTFYLSTGVITRLINGLDPDPRSRNVFTFHRPEELLRLVSQEASCCHHPAEGLAAPTISAAS